MARTTEQIAAELDAFEIGPDYMDRLDLLMEEAGNLAEGGLLVDAVLRLIERYPHVDFGAPGPLVHAVEKFFGRGYEQKLVQSLARRPTQMTVWMLNRIINGAAGMARERYLTVLNGIANDPSADADAKESAKQFIEYQKRRSTP